MRPLTEQEALEENLYRRQLKWLHGYSMESYEEIAKKDYRFFKDEKKQERDSNSKTDMV